MTDSQTQNSGTTEVRAQHRFDEARLAAWMVANVEGFSGPLTVEQFKGGQSNPTYKLVTPERAYVLRRKPPGKIVQGAHAVEREAKVINALEKVTFPVPHIHGLCTDESVIGTWFYVMDMVEGRIFWDATLPEIPAGERPAYFNAMADTLARLHDVDYPAIGLADYGRPTAYVERQVRRWTKQYHADLAEAGAEPSLEALIDWLPANIPDGDQSSISHGDFRIDNMIFHPSEPRVIAVLDWELSTIGHPLADFAYNLMMYRMPPVIIAGLEGADLVALNIPSEADYIARYCRQRGIESVPNLDFYVAFNLFRLAAIFHGIKARIARGTAASAHAHDMVAALPSIAALAWRQAQEARA
ncbi:phosphotransferase [soil metagenome]